MSNNLNKIKSPSEIEAMREGGRALAEILQVLKRSTKPGISTKDLANIAADELRKRGMKPAFLNYHGFPDVVCITINNEVQHTIPSPKKIIADGDIINCDFGVLHKGLITDAAITYPVNPSSINNDVKRLLKGTEEALLNAISIIKDGVSIKQISAIIEQTLKSYNLGIVEDLVGHGVGHNLHEDPEIPNFKRGSNNFRLKAGMTIAVEPITTLGSDEVIFLPDGWNIITKDGSWSAQFEHSILVLKDGCEVLTKV
jgi:methionyl aminopeptidase